jgi:hypothetical protein
MISNIYNMTRNLAIEGFQDQEKFTRYIRCVMKATMNQEQTHLIFSTRHAHEE